MFVVLLLFQMIFFYTWCVWTQWTPDESPLQCDYTLKRLKCLWCLRLTWYFCLDWSLWNRWMTDGVFRVKHKALWVFVLPFNLLYSLKMLWNHWELETLLILTETITSAWTVKELKCFPKRPWDISWLERGPSTLHLTCSHFPGCNSAHFIATAE